MVFKVPHYVYLSVDLLQDDNVLPARYHFCQVEDDLWKVYVHFPKSGQYQLRVFAKQKLKEGPLKWVLEYKLQAQKKTDSQSGFSYKFDLFSGGFVDILAAEETASEVAERLSALGLGRAKGAAPRHRFYVSDVPHRFREQAERFLGACLPDVEVVSVDELPRCEE